MDEQYRGVVRSKKPNGIVKVVLDDGQFSIVEPLGEDLAIGDVIVGNLWSLGGEELYNETQDVTFSAFIQDHS